MHEVAVTTAHKLINHIVDGICSPPRTPSPEVVSCLVSAHWRREGQYHTYMSYTQLSSVPL